MGSKYTPEHLASISADPIPLSQRLRGDYGIRSFDTTPIQHVAADALDAKDARIRELEEAVDLLKMLFGHPQTAIKFEPGGALIQIALDNDGLRTLHQAQTLHPNWFTNPLPAQPVSGLPSVSPNPKESPC